MWDNIGGSSVASRVSKKASFLDLDATLSFMTELEDTTVWHSDGHSVYMVLNRNELEIQVVTCPGGEGRECEIGKFDCIVDYFLGRYGLDCNVGVSEVNSTMEIAWSVQGDVDDPETCQVWVIPLADEAFSAWLSTQNISAPDTQESDEHQDG